MAAVGEHGSRRRYAGGCRCEPCKQAEREYRNDYNRRKKIAKPAGEVVEMRRGAKRAASERSEHSERSESPAPAEPKSDGPVVTGVKAELEMLNSAVDRPGQAQAAIRLAKVLDNDLAIAQHSSAANRLHEILTALGKGGRNRKGNLASVRQMTTGTG